MTLRTQIQDLEAKLANAQDEADAMVAVAEDEGRDLSQDEINALETNHTEQEGFANRLETLRKLENKATKIAASKVTADTFGNVAEPVQSKLPARVARQKSEYFSSSFQSDGVSQWMAGVMGNRRSQQWATENGFGYTNAMSEGTDSAGGFAVPDPLSATIIDLMESYGVVRRFADPFTMSSDTQAIPKLSSDTTVYYPAEGAAITASDLTLAQVSHTARKYAQLTIMSTELAEDAVINMADRVARSMARQFAKAEDTNAFLGDGTSTYGSITGVDNALAAGATVTSSGATIAATALSDFEDMIARTRDDAAAQEAFFMSKYTYHTAVVPALRALGGTDIRQIEDTTQGSLYGYPVIFTAVLPSDSTATTGDMIAVFGDLSLACSMGVRREVTMRTLNELYAANDQIGVVATLRSDFVCHDVGTASVAGALTKLDVGS